MLFLIKRYPTQCKKKLFSNSKILLKERSLPSNKELKTIWKKNKRQDKLRKKKERMRMKRQVFNKCLRLKKLRISSLTHQELRVNGKLRLKLSLTLLMLKLISSIIRLLLRQDLLKPRSSKKLRQKLLRLLRMLMPIKPQLLPMPKKKLLH